MDYFAESINESPVLALKAGAALTEVGGCAVGFDADGEAVLASADTAAIGVALLTNDESIPAGGDVQVQYKDIGLVKAGGAFNIGDKLAPDANGALVKDTSGAYIAIALQAASAPGALVQAIVERGTVAAASTGNVTPPKDNE
ncbi:MAG: DUF2190 family protein [Ruminiclostridium sp.]|jgi:hypothetical protein|nr:DUF2190 family protein [Ruminiclostridium sp.]